MGAYGYLDDHPLAAAKDLPPARYLALRAEMLLDLVRGIEVFYLYHHVQARSLGDGFKWAEACHARGIQLDAWTLDLDREGMAERVGQLATAGVDLFTTNTPREMAALFASM
jgi:glycerophosphoryl diester phosphodiesterase